MRQLLRSFFITLLLFCFVFSQSNVYAASKSKKKTNSNVAAPEPEPSKPAPTYSNIISPQSAQEAIATNTQQKVSISSSHLISVNYTNANLYDVLQAIAYSYSLNLVLTKDISGKVTAQLKDLTLEDALNAILNVNNYAFMRRGNIVYIMPQSEMQPSVESVPLSFLSPKEAKDFLNSAITGKSSVEANETTNSLIIKGDPTEIENIKQIIKTVDVPPIQVLIETKIVDINKHDVQTIDSAVGLLYTASSTGAQFLKYSPTVSANGTGTNPLAMPFHDNVTQGTDDSTASVTHTSKNILSQASINALITQHKARVLASPSIATLNGREASITIGEKRAYTAASNANAAGVQNTTAFVDAGTKLRVTPFVSPDGWITMKVHPEVSTFLGASGGLPDISTREAEATVRVKDNQTIVIGGLISRSDLRDENGVPFLKDIPLLGKLFTGHNSDIEDRELTVFITPHIIPMPIKSKASLAGDSSLRHDIDVLSGLLNYAESLEQDKTKDYAKNLYLSEEEIKTYRMILQQFPQSGKSDYCLYKIAFIYAKEFNKCDSAKEAMIEMKDFSPESPYLSVTESLVNACIAVNNPKDGK